MDRNEFNDKYAQLRIEIVETPPLSAEYIEFRDVVWKEKVQEWSDAGKEIFNGTLYRYMGRDGNTIKLGLMTYADRLVRTKISVTEIEKRFGKDHVMQNCCVDLLPITTDGKIVVGIKKNSVDLHTDKLAYIGGNMNKEEVRVRDFEDVYSMMMVEISEESNIPLEREKLSFIKLGLADGWASFYFVYRLDIPSERIEELFKDGEFVRLVAMSREEIKKTDYPAVGDLNLSKDWIDEV